MKIGQGHSEIFGVICQFLPCFLTSCSKISISAFLNSEVTGPMFDKFLHDVEALLPLLICTRRYCIPFRNARTKSEGGQFRSLQTASKITWLLCNVPLPTTKLMSVL